jgi:hypothetical protein
MKRRRRRCSNSSQKGRKKHLVIKGSYSSQHFFSVVWRKTSWPDRKMSSLSIESLEALRYPVCMLARDITQGAMRIHSFSPYDGRFYVTRRNKKKKRFFPWTAVSRWNRQHLKIFLIFQEKKKRLQMSLAAALLGCRGQGAREK